MGGMDDGDICRVDSDCIGAENICEPSGESCEIVGSPVVLGWVDDPFDAATNLTPPITFGARVTKTMPPFREWTEDVVHISDCEIAPAFFYAISATRDGVTFSDPLIMGTVPKPEGKHWGDVVGSFDGVEWSKPNGLVSVDDVLAIIKFLTLKPAPHLTVVELAGEVPNWLINATDLQLVLKAFTADPYPPLGFPTHVCEGGADDGVLCDPLVDPPPDCPDGSCTGFSPTDCP